MINTGIRTIAAATAVLAAGVLTGCGAAQPDAAAVVAGQTITTDDVDSAVTSAASSKTTQKLSSQAALFSLMAYPYVMKALERKKSGVSAQESLTKVFPGATNPSESLGKVAQVTYGASLLEQAEQQEVISELISQNITVNPKYGTFDVNKGWVQGTGNWMSPSASPAASPSAN